MEGSTGVTSIVNLVLSIDTKFINFLYEKVLLRKLYILVS